MTALAVGIFVGGAGERMGGAIKGLLRTPKGDESVVERLLRVCEQALPEAALYLVGQCEAYADLALPRLDDDPAGVGPIGGLCSLLWTAEREGARQALALACDLPFIDGAVLGLLGAQLERHARVPVVAGRFQPLAAAYAPTATLAAAKRALARGRHSLASVLDELGTDQLERLAGDEAFARALHDWDTPDDLTR